MPLSEPEHDCRKCDRLVGFRRDTALNHPDWFNGAVSSFGEPSAELLIVGLAPGLQGANRTGRPFTGDYAGDLLYATLLKFGLAEGQFDPNGQDDLELKRCMITNAVRCVPPGNKPTSAEINECRSFLSARINSLSNLRAIVVLGLIAHNSTLRALQQRVSAFPFQHGVRYAVGDDLALFDSYHCSRYNTNTGRLTTQMFESVFAEVKDYLG